MKNSDNRTENSEIFKNAPKTEPERQYYFIEQLKKIVEKKRDELGHILRFCCVTFGCQMNARDSEKLEGILEQAGFAKGEEDHADLVLYNTCTVRENANLKVYGHLGYLHSLKKKNPHMMFGLCGCMMQEPQAAEKIRKSYPFVVQIFVSPKNFKFDELLLRRMRSVSSVVHIVEVRDPTVVYLLTN